jgi:arabinose-5-phosphate isomerase
VIEVVSAIGQAGLGAVNVVDDYGYLMGIITDGDVRRLLQRVRSADLETLIGDAIMTRNPVVVFSDTLAYHALQLMEDRPSQISVLPVVDQERRCVGLIRLHDIVKSGL